MEEVVLVDFMDQMIGTQEKLSAHLEGKLHRAFSVFLFNSNGEMLLQQRAIEKYHSGGLWTNTCCSHPRPGEEVVMAAKRRLVEEVGIFCHLEKIFDFIYRAELDRGITEYEFDHVLAGLYNGDGKRNPKEVLALRWISLDDLDEEIKNFPSRFTFWFRQIMKDQRLPLLAARQRLSTALLYS